MPSPLNQCSPNRIREREARPACGIMKEQLTVVFQQVLEGYRGVSEELPGANWREYV